jgi:6-pyruvoyltetrahydropterin/6-carboxytetrahydropterin synthase
MDFGGDQLKLTKSKIVTGFKFSGAHKLSLPYNSKCCRLHGHCWRVEVEVEGRILEDGMVMDFTEIKKLKSELDHRYINEIIEQPTAENIAVWIGESVKNAAKNREISKIVVRVWENEDSYVELVFS